MALSKRELKRKALGRDPEEADPRPGVAALVHYQKAAHIRVTTTPIAGS
jgi:hypothetical protein